MTSEPLTPTPSADVGPSGLGGWLVLVALGLLLNPIRLLIFVLQTYPPVFASGAWENLTTPGTEFYHWLWGPLLVFELIGNSAVILACWGLLVLFFRRSRWFPRLFILFSLANLAFIVLDAWLGSLVVTDEPMFDPQTSRELARSLVAVLIWVPYMYRSRRVRNTFVK